MLEVIFWLAVGASASSICFLIGVAIGPLFKSHQPDWDLWQGHDRQ